MIKKYEFITFDLYGTLVDTKSSIMEFFRKISDGKIGNENAENLFNEWNGLNFKNINSKKISFKKSILETLEPILKKINLHSKENIDLFIDKYSAPQPFPETLDILKRLKHKAKLAIISNIDNDMINKIPFRDYFDFIITAEDAGYHYKPQKEIFEYSLKKLNTNKEKILHVASSIRADLEGVVPLGWDMVLLNRNKIPNNTNFKPLADINDFWKILDIID